ncbi:MAG: hypothetical protein MUE36_05620 [Acidimicrobiales bacterium]|jgi:hypothetical protein|nr:hypothetical protein [Acidimicrobiales bacterium]
MATIRATCPTCGDVELTTADVSVWVNAIDHRGTYSFTCPGCVDLVVKPAEPRTIDLLLASGVAYELSVPEVSAGPADAVGPISSREVAGFSELLSDDAQVWAAFEAAESPPHDRG